MTLAAADYATLLAATVFLSLGWYALVVARKNALAARFGSFGIWIAAYYVVSALSNVFAVRPDWYVAIGLLINMGWGLSGARLVAQSLHQWTISRRLMVVAAGITAVLFAGEFYSRAIAGIAPPTGAPFAVEWQAQLHAATQVLSNSVFYLVLATHPLLARQAAADATARVRSIATFSFGFAALTAGSLSFVPRLWENGSAAAMLAIANIALLNALPLVLWAMAMRGNHPRIARGMVLMLLGLAVVGTFLTTTSVAIAYGVLRIVGAVTLAYFALGGHVPGLETKLRFGVSKSTLAALFVAVFFVASEGAQAFFGDRFQNEYFGIGAAGLLVLAIAPMMRWADRLAVTAVPVQTNPEAAFRQTLRVVSADGRISPEEETELASLADQLGLSVSQVVRLRQEQRR